MIEYEFEIDGQKYFGNPVLEVGRLQKELAASQAREAKLRDGLAPVTTWLENGCNGKEAAKEIYLLLQAPTDDTVMKEAIKQAKRDALMEAADKCDEDYRYKVLSKHLRRMAEELK